MRTGDEDESLRDDGDLEVDNGVELVVVVVVRSRCLAVRERNTKLAVEPVGTNANSDKSDPDETLVKREV